MARHGMNVGYQGGYSGGWFGDSPGAGTARKGQFPEGFLGGSRRYGAHEDVGDSGGDGDAGDASGTGGGGGPAGIGGAPGDGSPADSSAAAPADSAPAADGPPSSNPNPSIFGAFPSDPDASPKTGPPAVNFGPTYAFSSSPTGRVGHSPANPGFNPGGPPGNTGPSSGFAIGFNPGDPTAPENIAAAIVSNRGFGERISDAVRAMANPFSLASLALTGPTPLGMMGLATRGMIGAARGDINAVATNPGFNGGFNVTNGNGVAIGGNAAAASAALGGAGATAGGEGGAQGSSGFDPSALAPGELPPTDDLLHPQASSSTSPVARSPLLNSGDYVKRRFGGLSIGV